MSLLSRVESERGGGAPFVCLGFQLATPRWPRATSVSKRSGLAGKAAAAASDGLEVTADKRVMKIDHRRSCRGSAGLRGRNRTCKKGRQGLDYNRDSRGRRPQSICRGGRGRSVSVLAFVSQTFSDCLRFRRRRASIRPAKEAPTEDDCAPAAARPLFPFHFLSALHSS